MEMLSFWARDDTVHHSKPKTPLIAGIVCGACIGIAWSISFLNWVLKQYRRRRLRQKRRLREASGTSTVYQRPRRRPGAYEMSSSDVGGGAGRATRGTEDDAGSTTSERIDRLVRQVSKDSDNPNVNRNNLRGIPLNQTSADTEYDDHKSIPSPQTTLSPGAAARPHVPSWVPPPLWDKHAHINTGTGHDRHARQPAMVSSPTDEAYSLSPITPETSHARYVSDELEDIDLNERAKTDRDVARALLGV